MRDHRFISDLGVKHVVYAHGEPATCSHSWLMIPDANSPLWADPETLPPFEPGDLATAKNFDSGVVREVFLVRRESEFRSAFGRTRKPPTGEWLCFFKQEGEHPAGWIAASEIRKVTP